MKQAHQDATDNVYDLFTGKPVHWQEQTKIIRIAPELDGLEMLYSNDTSPDKLYSLKILCWGLTENGDTVGMVPWLDGITACTSLQDPLNGHWRGYYDPNFDDVFYEAPAHKSLELKSASDYYRYHMLQPDDIVQEIPDAIGTHAIFSTDGFNTFFMAEVLSWRLFNDGTIIGMLVNDEDVQTTPVLPGDTCLYEAQSHPDFKYFFQHRIANKIKANDPDALAAMTLLMDS